MTERENMLMVLRGEVPEWLPRYGAFPDPTGLYPHSAIMGIRPSILAGHRGPQGGKDIFGVEYTPTDSTGGMSLPTPNSFILDDIRKWRDVIKVPDISDVDWEMVTKKDMERVDRTQSVISLGTHNGYFQHLMAFMGFTEGLCVMLEEPEEVYALFDYLATFYDKITAEYMYYCKPDVLAIGDDTATSLNPFISLDMYRTLLKPFYMRQGKFAIEAGIRADMHNCGRCEDQIEDWFDFGIGMWNPAQIMNDLTGIKKKYGNKLILIGCWDSSGPAGWPGAKEEFVRSEVRRCIDTFAPGGGFCFWGNVYGPQDDPQVKVRASWLTDEYNNYGRNWYKTH
jgi:hypothetical protein